MEPFAPAIRFCLFVPLCLLRTAGAADSLPDFSNLTLQQLSETKITSVSRSQQSLSRAAAAVYVINREEIHRSGMTNARRSAATRAGSECSTASSPMAVNEALSPPEASTTGLPISCSC